MSAGCLFLGKYGKHVFIKKTRIPFRRHVLGWIVVAVSGVILAMGIVSKSHNP